MELTDIQKKALALYKAPFKYDALGGYIWDANGEMVSDDKTPPTVVPGDWMAGAMACLRIRGWGSYPVHGEPSRAAGRRRRADRSSTHEILAGAAPMNHADYADKILSELHSELQGYITRRLVEARSQLLSAARELEQAQTTNALLRKDLEAAKKAIEEMRAAMPVTAGIILTAEQYRQFLANYSAPKTGIKVSDETVTAYAEALAVTPADTGVGSTLVRRRRAGHPSGRGHGPGGRLDPATDDLVEIFVPKECSWEVTKVLRGDVSFGPLMGFETIHGRMPYAALKPYSEDWRWPLKTCPQWSSAAKACGRCLECRGLLGR